MAKMLVIGSLELTDPARTEFLKSLGAEIAEEGHHLLNGCRNDLDKIVAQGASERLKAKGRDPAMLITCYVSGASRPVHDCGTILKSRCPNWESLA
jgi:predicted Rossmann-fold nucleotide-binding protein